MIGRVRPRGALAVLGGLALLAGSAVAVAGPPPVQAAGYLLVHPGSGERLAAEAPDGRLPLASITKIMTGLIVLERVTDRTALVTIPAESAIGGSSAELIVGERLSVADLLTALMVGSGNDSAVALAVHVAGSQPAFVALMNRRAEELGLRDTRFANPHGLDAPGQYSTPRDLIRLARLAMARPDFRDLVDDRRAAIPGVGGAGTRELLSKNDLLGAGIGVDGVKTGFTEGAGRAIVARAVRPAVGPLYLALIGSPSEAQRSVDARGLLLWGFAQYGVGALANPAAEVADVAVRDRPGVRLGLVVDRPVTAALRLGRPLVSRVIAPAEVSGPIRAGAVIGRLELRQGNRIVARRRLVADRAVGGPSPWDRVRSGLGRALPW